MHPARILPLLLATVALVASARTAAAQQDDLDASDPVVGKLDQRVTRFLDSVADGSESTAFAELLLGSQLSEQDSAVRELVERSKEIPRRYGPHQENEQIAAKRIGKDLVLLKYLYKCERFPVVWYFVFYRDFRAQAGTTDDQWVAISIRFDTQIELLFQ